MENEAFFCHSMPGSELSHSCMGWFAVALSHEIRGGHTIFGTLAGKPFELHRTQGGCLTFNKHSDNVCEQNGFVLAWNHPSGAGPMWRIPILNEEDWSPVKHYMLKARTHPQELFENSIDAAHFSVVHGYSQTNILQKPCFTNHEMTVRCELVRQSPLRFLQPHVKANFVVHLHGLGCAHNHINVPTLKMRVRMFVFATPTTVGWVDIRLGVAIAKRLSLPFAGLFRHLIHKAIAKNLIHDFCQDLKVWENKCYLPKPMLVKGDGPIMAFRHWCKQFYFEGASP